ncbi:MAG: hypothetical protein ACREHD_26680, partial [Pirellulales bacterium]
SALVESALVESALVESALVESALLVATGGVEGAISAADEGTELGEAGAPARTDNNRRSSSVSKRLLRGDIASSAG